MLPIRWLYVPISIISILVICICSSCAGASRTAEHTPQITPTETPAVVDEVYELYVTAKCISCHGDQFEGRIGEATNLQLVGSRRSEEEIAHTIRKGGNGMPSYETKLSDEEITLLAVWLSAKK